jgi:WD40 repeat protein
MMRTTVLCWLLFATSGCAFNPKRHETPAAAAGSAARSSATPRASDVLLVPQSGHTSEVWSLAFNPDGRFLASGGLDHTVCVWTTNGRLVAELVGHQEAVTSLAWHPESRALASTARDGRIIVWDLDRNAPRLIIRRSGFDLEWLPDGRAFAVAGPSAELSLFSAGSGKLLEHAATPGSQGRQILELAVNPTGKSIATRSLDGHLHLWQAQPLAFSTSAPVGHGYSRRLRWNRAGDVLAAGNGDSIAFIDGAGSILRQIRVPGGDAELVDWLPHGSHFVVESDRGVFVLDASTGAVSRKLSPLGVVEALALSPDGRLLASSHDMDSQVRLWQLEERLPFAALGPHGMHGRAASFSRDGLRIAAGRHVWDAKHGRVLAHLKGAPELGSPLWSPDGVLLAVAERRGVRIVRSDSGKHLGFIPEHDDDWGFDFTFSPDGGLLAVGAGRRLSVLDPVSRVRKKALAVAGVAVTRLSWTQQVLAVAEHDIVELWDTRSWRVASTISAKALASYGRIAEIALSADARRIAVAGDQEIAVFDVRSGSIEQQARKRSGYAGPRFSPNGKLVAYAAPGRTVQIWDGVTLDPSIELRGAVAPIRVIAWSPDGKHVAASCDDGTVHVWNAQSRALVRTFVGHEQRVWDLVWHPEGTVLLATSQTARLHRLSDGATLTLRADPNQPAGIVHDELGNFDGDPAAIGMLGFRVGAQFPDVELLPNEEAARRFQKPGLVAGFWERARR